MLLKSKSYYYISSNFDLTRIRRFLAYGLLLLFLTMFAIKITHSAVGTFGNVFETSNDTSVSLVGIFTSLINKLVQMNFCWHHMF